MSILGRPKRKQDVKKSAIKKFADSYRVGIAYMGLAELRLKNKHQDTDSYYYRHIYEYEGEVSTKDMASVGVTADVTLTVMQKHYRKDGVRDFDIYPPNKYNDFTQEQYDVMSHNIEGLVTNEFSADIYYYYYNEIKGENELILRKRVGSYYSIEDILDAISTESEVAWGEVAIKLRDYMDELRVFRHAESNLPNEVTIQMPEGNQLVLKKPWSSAVGDWRGEWSIIQDNITLHADIRIRAVGVEGEEYGERNYFNLEDYEDEIGYYAVRVSGIFEDGNTDLSTSRTYSRPDDWRRRFEDQGAETLAGAKAIAEANIRELYQEFTDYLNSERNYVQVSHGRGYARTTENENEWNYNFGDSQDDVHYENWDDERDDYWDYYWDNQPAYNRKWASAKKSKSVPQFSSVVAKLRKKE